MDFIQYPLQFEPIFKDRIWGGSKLRTELGKEIPSETTGESWELSGVKGDVSIVSNGNYKGRSLQELIEEHPQQLLGESVYKRFGNEFPLLFKFLDAREDLSIQVHPNDDLARERHNSFGKTEMWYILSAEPNSRIIVGFEQKSNKQEYLDHLKNDSLLDLLEKIPTQPGDVFFLETGTVHAIGAGILLAEIQQTSDITYRLYDFNRKDANGNTRELHVDLALDAINYEEIDSQKVYETTENVSNTMVDCDYFTTNYLRVHGSVDVSKSGESFTVYMCVDGSFTLSDQTHNYSFQKGQTVLIPAALKRFSLTGEATLLEIYIS